MGKIFCIGLNKTGTRSLANALRILGFRTLHRGDDLANELVEQAEQDGFPLLSYLGDNYEAYLDVDALVRRFALLDQQYPGSKFILTTRDLWRWLDSRERHVRANQQNAVEGSYTGSWLEIDLEAWVRVRRHHTAAVLAYFADRPEDLLVTDVTAGDGWQVLAPFLGCRVPRVPFPWENRAGAGTYVRQQSLMPLRVARFARRMYGRFAYRRWTGDTAC